ncbi:MAG: DMT family transporter [Paracoccaceae bacterium]
MSSTSAHNNLFGISSAIIASVFFSVNDMTVKFLSDDFALHQIILIRSTIGMIVLLTIFIPFEGGLSALRTSRLPIHVLRGFLVVIANMCFFLALSVLPLADAVAIFFASPLIITVFSVVFLGESVGPRRWIAVGMGFAGVIIMVRPGPSSFQLAALLPVVAAFAYAGLQTITRKVGGTERAGVLTFYIQVTFILVGSIMGLTVGDGRFGGTGDTSLDFLLREWIWPTNSDWGLLVILGISSTFAGYFISQAYRLCEAGLASPFEYTGMVLAIFWGVLIFDEWPDTTAWIGISLIVGGGLFMLWRAKVINNAAKRNSADLYRP